MGLSILPIGGHGEVGKNCTAIIVDDEIVLCDLGLHLENWIAHTEDRDDVKKLPAKVLIGFEAVPDIELLGELKKNVVAVVPSHAHLDHIGAIPFLGNKFDAPVICTPYTAEVLKAILSDEKIELRNEIIDIKPNSKFKVSEKITIELINVTHSIPHAAIIVIHTPYGQVVYANDYKLDPKPTLGQKTNTKRLEELDNVQVLISECLYAGDHRRMPSESIAKQMLRHVMLEEDTQGKGLIVSTFSSQIARLKSIVEFGEKLNRKIILIGRSLSKYATAAQNTGIMNFEGRAEFVKYRDHMERTFKKVMKQGKDKYLLVVTGHQGEPKAVLSRMVDKKFAFRFDENDHMIFSCKIIPTETTRKHRKILEEKIKKYKCRIYTDIHASGHAAREDLRDYLRMINPKHVIPSHGELGQQEAYASLAEEEGYDKKHIHILKNGKKLNLTPSS